MNARARSPTTRVTSGGHNSLDVAGRHLAPVSKVWMYPLSPRARHAIKILYVLSAVSTLVDIIMFSVNTLIISAWDEESAAGSLPFLADLFSDDFPLKPHSFIVALLCLSPWVLNAFMDCYLLPWACIVRHQSRTSLELKLQARVSAGIQRYMFLYFTPFLVVCGGFASFFTYPTVWTTLQFPSIVAQVYPKDVFWVSCVTSFVVLVGVNASKAVCLEAFNTELAHTRPTGITLTPRATTAASATSERTSDESLVPQPTA